MNERLKKFILGVSAIAELLLGMFDALFPDTSSNNFFVVRIVTLIVIVIIIVMFIVFQFLRKRIFIKVGKVRVGIIKGNLFNQKNIVVIPCDSKFTMELETRIISDKSIQGLFIDKFSQNLGDIKEIPKTAMKELVLEEKRYILYPLCIFTDDNRAKMTRKELYNSLLMLWEGLDKVSNLHEISVPLIGSGNLRVNPSMTDEECLKMIIDSISIFGFSRDTKINIILWKTKININKVRSNNEL